MIEGFRISPAARARLLSIRVDASRNALIPTLFWSARSVVISQQGDIKTSAGEVFGIGWYERATLVEQGCTMEIDGLEFFILPMYYERLTGKVLEFSDGVFFLKDRL